MTYDSIPTVQTRLVARAPRAAPTKTRRLVLGAAVAATALLGCGYVTTEAILPPWLVGNAGPIPYVVPAACTFDNGDRIALQADTGKYVGRCTDCVANATSDVAFVLAPTIDGHPSTVWKVFNTGRRGILALQADTGKFLARCSDCTTPAAYVDVDHWSEGAYAQWTCVLAADGRIALRADTGKYLTRHGATEPHLPADVAVVHADDWTMASAQWAVDRLPVSSACAFQDGQVVSIQADNGNFVAPCADCLDVEDAVVTASALAPWMVFNTGSGKLVFQADSGAFLTREYKLVRGATVLNQAFTRDVDWTASPWAEFTCVDLGNGKVALQADTGKYVARCSDCVPGAAMDVVAMHVQDPATTTTAQWTIVRGA